MMEDLMRGWENFIARPSGPLHLRFLIQPAVGVILALIAGLKDARAGNPPYLWAMLTNADYRKALLHEGWKDMRTPFIVSLILDAIYQLICFKTIYFFELLFTAFFLALMPYLIFRGLINRAARLFIKP
ncbi:hypothetical protein ACFLR2_01425 [Chlamydiota bacterium]